MKTAEQAPADRLRQRLYRGRDAAHVAACRCQSLDAGEICHIASQFAAAWMFKRSVDGEQLQAAIQILRWLFLAARALERLEAPDA
jgi:hypothetical protein